MGRHYHSRIKNDSGQTCAQSAFCTLPNCLLNLLGEQKRAQSTNLRYVCTEAEVDDSDKLRAI